MVFGVHTIKEVKDKIGLICSQQRKANQLSRKELAEALDISATTIQNLENGKNATLDTILKVANHFGLLSDIYKSLDDFIESDDNLTLY
jgi:transcriptional regulator with XRE-family HTH domain